MGQPLPPSNLPPGKKRRRSELQHTDSDANKEVFNSERFHVKLDENGAVTELAEQQLAEFNLLFAKGLRCLSIREHSVAEIRNKLFERQQKTALDHQCFTDLVEETIQELLDRQYLSDERFAESYVRARKNKGFGPIKISAELSQKGVADFFIDEFVNQNDEIWFEIAKQQCLKKYHHSDVSSYAEWTKRARFLQSRGFRSDHIQSAIEPFNND